MGLWSNLMGTTEPTLQIGKGKSTLNASAITAARTHTLPNISGTLALLSDIPTAGPSFSAYMSAPQTTTSGAFVKLNFDTERFDTHGCYDTTNKRFMPGVAGKYVVSALFDFVAATGLTIAILSIFKNGVEFIRLQDLRGPSGTVGACGGGDVIDLNATDYIEVHAYLVATTPRINFDNLPQLNSFSAVMVGSAGGGGGGSSSTKVTKTAIALGTLAANQTAFTYTTIPTTAARGLMSQLIVESTTAGVFDLVVRGADNDAGTLWLSAVSVAQKLYTMSLPVYVENDFARQDFYIGIRNRSNLPATFTLNNLRMEKFA